MDQLPPSDYLYGEDCLKILREAGARMDIVNDLGLTPAYIATQNGVCACARRMPR
jgi:hypothetical protein